MKTRVRILAWLGLTFCSVTAASAVQATFQLNMGVQTAMGLFDPATDFVFVPGTWNSWSTSAQLTNGLVADTNVYVGAFDVGAAGTTNEYKFIKNTLLGGQTWEQDGVGTGPPPHGNRLFVTPSTDTNLPVVYFNPESCVIWRHPNEV
jgi:hypothetical protein